MSVVQIESGPTGWWARFRSIGRDRVQPVSRRTRAKQGSTACHPVFESIEGAVFLGACDRGEGERARTDQPVRRGNDGILAGSLPPRRRDASSLARRLGAVADRTYGFAAMMRMREPRWLLREQTRLPTRFNTFSSARLTLS